MRKAEISRKTAETDVKVTLDLDGSGKGSVSTGIGFFDHMLQLFLTHSRYDLVVECAGDTQVDFHHRVEDVGIALGEARGAQWFSAGKRSRRGHPHHPLYLRKDSPLEPFDVGQYLTEAFHT